jgi:hypothetical protein
MKSGVIKSVVLWKYKENLLKVRKVKSRQGRWICKSVIALLLKHYQSHPNLPSRFQSLRVEICDFIQQKFIKTVNKSGILLDKTFGYFLIP